MREVWQTTNQQPWVEALAAGVITAKTRSSFPRAPIGATVLLHASKARLWPDWKGLGYLLKRLPEKNPDKWDRGVISAIAVVEAVGWSDKILKESEYKFWDVYNTYNSVGYYTVRFKNIVRLTKPVATRGFQAPFCRARQTTVDAILRSNPELERYFK
jgi:hypothetical protein